MPPSALRSGLLTLASALAAPALLQALAPAEATAAQLFEALAVEQSRFVIVAVPIGTSGTKAQLQIYEQIDPKKRACYEVSPGTPAAVAPLLGTFDFTGICRRYIDSQGYSARIGGEDLGSTYRFVVRKVGDDNLLMAAPAGGSSAKPEMLVGRTYGTAAPTAFLAFRLEPGWQVMRRAYGGRALGHVYLHRPDWPGAAPVAGPAAKVPAAAAPALVAPPSPPAAPVAVAPTKTPTPAPRQLLRGGATCSPVSGVPATASKPASPCP